jgi:ribose transport system substrate-binding protein
MNRKWKHAFSSSIVLLLVGGTVACGQGSTSGGTTQGSAACIQEAQSLSDAARKPIALNVPKDPVNMKANAGKTVWFISVTQAIPFVAAISDGFKAAAAAAGMKAVVYDAKGTVTGFNAGVNQAIAQHADGIALQGINPELVSGAMQKAKAAGIPVVDSFNGSPSQALSPGLINHVTADFQSSGKKLADYILADSKCTANTVIFTTSIFTIHADMTNGATNEIKRLCPTCKVTSEVVDLNTMATGLGPQTETVIRRDPTVSYMLAVFDGQVVFMLPAIQSSGKNVKVVSHDGVDANLDYVRKGQVQIADGAFPPNQYMGWAEVDALGRGLAKLPPVDETIPDQLFDKSSLPATSAEMFPAYADFAGAFKKIWGV